MEWGIMKKEGLWILWSVIKIQLFLYNLNFEKILKKLEHNNS